MKIIDFKSILGDMRECQSGHGTPVDNVQIQPTMPAKMDAESVLNASAQEINRRMHDPDYQW
jgi:hypothetical protein